MTPFKDSDFYNKLAYLSQKINKHRKIISFSLIAVFLGAGILISINSEAYSSRYASFTNSAKKNSSISLNGANDEPVSQNNEPIVSVPTRGLTATYSKDLSVEPIVLDDATQEYNITITQSSSDSPPSNTITVGDNCKATITLSGKINIEPNDSTIHPISIGNNADVTLIIQDGANVNLNTWGVSSIHVPDGANLTIEGSGLLKANGLSSNAAIGADRYESCGNININMIGENGNVGTLDVNAASACAIGGSVANNSFCKVGAINITAGKIHATNTGYAATIGSGYYTQGGHPFASEIDGISISGAKTFVTAINKSGGEYGKTAIGIGGEQLGVTIQGKSNISSCKINISDDVGSLLAISYDSNIYTDARAISKPNSESNSTAHIIQQRFQKSVSTSEIVNEDTMLGLYDVSSTSPFNAVTAERFTLPAGTAQYAYKMPNGGDYNIVRINLNGTDDTLDDDTADRVLYQYSYTEYDTPAEFSGSKAEHPKEGTDPWETVDVNFRNTEYAMHASIANNTAVYNGEDIHTSDVGKITVSILGVVREDYSISSKFVNASNQDTVPLNVGNKYKLQVSSMVTDISNTYIHYRIPFSITKATLSVQPDAVSVYYGDDVPSSFSASYSGYVGKDIGNEDSVNISGPITYTTPYDPGEPVGEYAINADISKLSADNYEFTTVPGTLTVNKTNVPSDKDIIITGPLNGTIEYGQMLGDLYDDSGTVPATAVGIYGEIIQGKFEFANSTERPNKVGDEVGPYIGTFTPNSEDNINYKTTGGLEVYIEVKRAKMSISDLSASFISYSQCLGESTLSAIVRDPHSDDDITNKVTLSWADDTIKPQVSDSMQTKYQVIFTPIGDIADYYEPATQETTIEVHKYHLDPSQITIIEATVEYGQRLGDASVSATAVGFYGETIEGTFNFLKKDEVPEKDGNNNNTAGPYKGIFTPTNNDNYRGALLTDVYITFDRVTPQIEGIISASEITYGDSLSASTLSATFKNPHNGEDILGRLHWENSIESSRPNAGIAEYTAVFTPSDRSIYKELTVSVSVTVNKAEPEITVNSATIEYGQTLGDVNIDFTATGINGVPLEGTFVFSNIDDTTKPNIIGNIGPFSGIFTPSDESNYKSKDISGVFITVEKVTPRISDLSATSITFGDYLESSKLSATVTNPYDNSAVPGNLSWKDGHILPEENNSEYTVVFTPTYEDKYKLVEISAIITITENDDILEVISEIEKLNTNDNPSQSDIDSIVHTTLDYNALSDTEKTFIAKLDLEALQKAQKNAGVVNHEKDGVKVANDNLPWYAALVVDTQSASDSAKRLLTSTQTILKTQDIHLKNLLTGEKYSDDVGDIIVQLENPDLTGFSSLLIIHEKPDGSAEPITPTVATKDITKFSTKSFSVFSLVGDTESSTDSTTDPNNDSHGNNNGNNGGNNSGLSGSTGNNSGSSATNSFSSTSDNSTVPTIILICVLVLSGIIIVALVCLKNKKSYKH